MRLNIGSGTFPAAGWCNLDVVETDLIRPDLIVEPGAPLPFEAGTVEKVYAGHVLEHVPWHEVGGFLGECRRVLESGGEIMVVGPDVVRTLERWRDGLEPWDLVESVIEHELSFQTAPVQWPNARHHWNCREDRVVGALERAGFEHVQAVPVSEGDLVGWPVVAYTQHQCAVKATK